jgi:hypothetical protein
MAAALRPSRQVRAAFWLLALGLALAHAIAQRFHMSPDGIAYLDLADAWRRWDLAALPNGYWSPAWPALLGLALALLDPAPLWESTVVHLLLLPCMAFSLLAFEVFWGRLGRGGSSPREWWGLGYGLWLWTTLVLVTAWQITPDLLVAGWLYLAAAWLLEDEPNGRGWALFGVGWGLAYLTKLVLLPLGGLVFLLALGRAAYRHGVSTALHRALPAVLALVLVAGPWGTTLSLAKGRPTAGDAGRLNYAWYVNGLFGGGQHWQGEEPGQRAEHPTRLLRRDPMVFEFAEPVDGTYAPWADPSYWHEGVRLTVDVRRQARVVGEHLALYAELFGVRLGFLLLGTAVLFGGWRPGVSGWTVLVPLVLGGAALGLYALVHVEERFLGAPVVFLWGALWAAAPERLASSRWRRMVAALLVAGLLFQVAWQTAALAVRQREALTPPWSFRTHRAAAVAEALGEAGVGRGAEVAFVGYGMDAYWARLAGVRITADVYSRADLPELAGNVERFWALAPAERETIYGRFTDVGASAVVARAVPPGALPEGWRALGVTGYFVLRLVPHGEEKHRF